MAGAIIAGSVVRIYVVCSSYLCELQSQLLWFVSIFVCEGETTEPATIVRIYICM